MERARAHPLPAKDPISGGPLVITEVEAVESGVTIRGRFEVPRFASLSPDQSRYLETFLRCRGMLNSVERELGISYPTARARLDAVLRALGLHAVREEPQAAPKPVGTIAPGEPVEDASPEEPTTLDPEPWVDSDDEPEAPFEIPSEDPEAAEDEGPRYTREEILSMLERGELSVEDVKRELGRAK